MLTEDTFHPQIAFFGQISPPLPQLQFAKTAMGTASPDFLVRLLGLTKIEHVYINTHVPQQGPTAK